MIDRVEELLGMMAAEEDDDGQEDVPALMETAALAPPPGEGDGAVGQLAAGAGQGPWAAERPGQDAGERLPEDGRAIEGRLDGMLARLAGGGSVREAEAAARRRTAEAVEQAAQTLKAAGAEAVEAAEKAARGIGDGGAPAGGMTGQEAVAGLERLYRKTAGAVRPAAPALPAAPAGRTVRAEEPGSAASLAVDELDRAIRRDSRRYDGGMNIF